MESMIRFNPKTGLYETVEFEEKQEVEKTVYNQPVKVVQYKKEDKPTTIKPLRSTKT